MSVYVGSRNWYLGLPASQDVSERQVFGSSMDLDCTLTLCSSPWSHAMFACGQTSNVFSDMSTAAMVDLISLRPGSTPTEWDCPSCSPTQPTFAYLRISLWDWTSASNHAGLAAFKNSAKFPHFHDRLHFRFSSVTGSVLCLSRCECVWSQLGLMLDHRRGLQCFDLFYFSW